MEYIDLNKGWSFYESDESMSFIFSKPEAVTVDLPHDFIIHKPRSADAPGGCGNGFFGQGEGVYKKLLNIPDSWKNKTVILDIDGAYMNTEIAVNGELIGLHPYGYTPWLADISRGLRFGGKKNELKIITQSRQPGSRWYSGGGLYRSVGLWVGNKVYINPWDVFVTTQRADAKGAELCMEVTVTNHSGEHFEGRLICSVCDGLDRTCASGELLVAVAAGEKLCKKIMLTLESPRLWSVKQPDLYSFKTVLINGGDQSVVDEAASTFGIRTITADAKNGFLLNGESIKLKGGCIHHDNGLLGACAYPKAEARKIQLLKAAGYNAVRISHHPPSRVMLEACDRLGMLLLDECFDVWRMGKTPLDYHLYFEDWWERDIEAMVKRDRNHPCVICYSIGNEIGERDGRGDGYAWAKRLNAKVKALDDTRPTLTAVCGVFDDDDDIGTNFEANALVDEKDIWGKRTEKFVEPVDIVGYNYLYQRYEKDHERWPKRVMIGTETHAYTTYDYWEQVKKHPYVLGDFIWAAVDYLGETGCGKVYWENDREKFSFMAPYPWRTSWQSDLLMTGERRPQSYYRELMWEHSQKTYLFTTHPKHYGEKSFGTPWRWDDVDFSWSFGDEWIGRPVAVEAYSPGDYVEFFLNGRSFGTSAVSRLKASLDIPYEPGILEAVTYKEGRVLSRAVLETAGEASKLLIVPEEDFLTADGMDLAYIHIYAADEKERRVLGDEREIRVSVQGPAKVLAVGSGSPCTKDLIGTQACHMYRGAALVILKAAEPGTITVTASTPDGTCGIGTVAARSQSDF